jgi:tetratricopeptide (TPR) repeat protein
VIGGTRNRIADGTGNVQAGGDAHATYNDLAAYEAQVQARIDRREAELHALYAERLAARDDRLAAKDDIIAARDQRITLLQQQVETDRMRLAEPQRAFADYQARIAELERLLAEATGATPVIGANRIADARAAAELGDYAAADAIFAEVEALEAEAVRRAADAAFGRGLIAEEQVRWPDAATHYESAARLNPTYDTLVKAGMFLSRAGRQEEALAVERKLVALSRSTHGPQAPETATALNNLAETLRALGRYDQAEPLYREALEISRAMLGDRHPDVATMLNNLAGLLRNTRRPDQATPLYLAALSIYRARFGDTHPGTRTIATNTLIHLRDHAPDHPDLPALAAAFPGL